MASSSSMSSHITFDGGRRQRAATIVCQLCENYGHEHTSHFAYLTETSDATWQFATVSDPDIKKIMDKFEPEEQRPHVQSPGDVLVQACFKCCGLKVHNDELFYVKEKDGVIIEPDMPSNQFKKLANKTMKSEAGDLAVRNLLARVERKLGSEKKRRKCV